MGDILSELIIRPARASDMNDIASISRTTWDPLDGPNVLIFRYIEKDSE